jgi:uncharacterized membrane protein
MSYLKIHAILLIMKRFTELDLLRSLAILSMVIYHTAYDLQQFYGWDIGVFSSGWKIFQISIASLFLLLVGVASSISHRHPLKRFIKIGAAALLVSTATYLIDPETYVRFGILHLIATAAILMPMMKWSYRRHAMASLLGIALIAAGQWIPSIETKTSLLIPFGIRPENFSSVDYFPIIPWFGVILIGYGVGWVMYGRPGRTDAIAWRLYPLSSQKCNTWISWPGRHSLLLYLIHQPLIIALLWIVLGKPQW